MTQNQILFPDMAVVKQKLYKSCINNIPEIISSSLSDISPFKNIKPGETIAIAVGSRGIDKINSVVLNCIQFLKGKGLKPFIVPAMGSHGGATAEGQEKTLEKLGITETSMGAPIFPEMETCSLDKLPCGLNIYFSKKALEADHIVVINRIKPHTKFTEDIESGLCKMLTIGLGKIDGAAEFHRFAIGNSFKIIEEAVAIILKKCNILFGLALTEDGYGNLSHIETIDSSSLIEKEKNLLKDVYKKMSKIPFDNLDILIVDYIGKNISGIGMDSNITGRHIDITGDFKSSPHVKRIFVRDLDPDSDGNANGIGLADFTTKRLVNAVEFEKTYINALTAISPEKAAIPIYFDSDRQVLNACFQTIGLDSTVNARIVRIKSTASLELMEISKTLEKEINDNLGIEQISEWRPLQFNNNGNLIELIG